jgi:hypothetical protein
VQFAGVSPEITLRAVDGLAACVLYKNCRRVGLYRNSERQNIDLELRRATAKRKVLRPGSKTVDFTNKTRQLLRRLASMPNG